MDMHIRILTPNDAPQILDLENHLLESRGMDPVSREMARWDAPWREESLTHYLNSGWSVGLWDDNKESTFRGYFLGQALLYYKGLTQVLWVEHLEARDEEGKLFLKDTAIRLGRDKHLQSVFLGDEEFKTTKR